MFTINLNTLPYLQVQSQTTTNGTQDVRKYYPVPPIQPSTYQYLDVNKDTRLRKEVTSYFADKTIGWIEKDESFKKHKSKLVDLKSIDGQIRIYHLLRKFVKHSGINWYDLRDNYSLIKKFINHKL